MFFSSAITMLLPYILLFGVLSTFFYGIKDKILPYNTSKEEKSIIYSESCSIVFDDHSNYNWTDYKNNEEDKTIHDKNYVQYFSLDDLQVIFIIDSSLKNKFFEKSSRTIRSIELSVFSLRGPPVYLT